MKYSLLNKLSINALAQLVIFVEVFSILYAPFAIFHLKKSLLELLYFFLSLQILEYHHAYDRLYISFGVNPYNCLEIGGCCKLSRFNSNHPIHI